MALNQGYSYRLVLGPEANGHEVLTYLSQAFDHSTIEQWRMRLLRGEILIDSVPAIGGEKLRAGSVLIWNRPPWHEEEVSLAYRVIYEDAQLLVVDKPSGLPTLPGAGFYLHTLLSQVQETYPEVHSVHRLGRATSGLVLFARDGQTAAILCRNWARVHKQYEALASGVASQDSYDIQVPIGPVPHPRLGTVHAASPSGKPARSLARAIERRTDATVFEVDLLTGRPHQIRIHLAAIDHPLVGDPLYTRGGIPFADRPGLPGDAGYFLRAKRIVLNHPATGQSVEIDAPMAEIPWPSPC